MTPKPAARKSASGHRSGARRAARRQIWLNALHSTAFLIVVILLKNWLVSDTVTFGLLDKHLRRAAYDLSQDWIVATRHEEIPVAVVDISSLPACPTPDDPTPRRSLQDALAAVLRQDPVAVAVDVDFSPGTNLSCSNREEPPAVSLVPKDCSAKLPELEWTDRGGPPLFQYCLRTKEKIFLGVYRQQYQQPANWLGAEPYAPLAASMLVPARGLEEDPGENEGLQARLYMDRFVQGCANLNSISQQLALAYPGDERSWLRLAMSAATPNRVKSWLFGTLVENQSLETSSRSSASIFLVDFSALPALEQDQAKFVKGELVNGGSLRGKVVLMGYTDMKNPATDRFIAPGAERQVAGVFWHACGADTLIRGPLLQPTAMGDIALDLGLYLPVIVLITLLNLHFTEESYREELTERTESIATKVLALLIFLCGTYFIGRLRIIWADFLIVALIVLMHPQLERDLDGLLGWLWRKIKAVPAPHRPAD